MGWWTAVCTLTACLAAGTATNPQPPNRTSPHSLQSASLHATGPSHPLKGGAGNATCSVELNVIIGRSTIGALPGNVTASTCCAACLNRTAPTKCVAWTVIYRMNVSNATLPTAEGTCYLKSNTERPGVHGNGVHASGVVPSAPSPGPPNPPPQPSPPAPPSPPPPSPPAPPSPPPPGPPPHPIQPVGPSCCHTGKWVSAWSQCDELDDIRAKVRNHSGILKVSWCPLAPRYGDRCRCFHGISGPRYAGLGSVAVPKGHVDYYYLPFVTKLCP